MSESSNCAFCHKPVEADDPTVHREVISWVSGPKLDSPVLREQTGRLACESCIHKLKLGQAVDQEPLI